MREARLSLLVVVLGVGGCHVIFGHRGTDGAVSDQRRIDDARAADARVDGSAAHDSRPREAGRADLAPADAKLAEGPATVDLGASDQVVGDLLTADLAGPADVAAPADVVVADQGTPACVHPSVSASCVSGWCAIPYGCFTMGSPTTENCRSIDPNFAETQHQVTLTHSFVMAEAPVTQGQYKNLMGYNPSFITGAGPSAPAERVTWHEAAAYCNALSAIELLATCYTCVGSGVSVSCSVAPAYVAKVQTCPGYRLPTEAEYEYATRAGSVTALYSGTLVDCGKKYDAAANAIAWYAANGSNLTHPVKQKQPNLWGLHDIVGNVWEWTNDWHTQDLGGSAVVDPTGAASGTGRVIRGGSYFDLAMYLRSAARYSMAPGTKVDTQGFRCVRTTSF